MECGHRLNGVRATDGLNSCFGKPEVLYLASLNQILHRARHIFYGHVPVNPVLIRQADGIHLQPLERAFDGLLDVLGPTIHTCR